VSLEVERASPSMLRSGLSSVALSALGIVLGFVSVPVMVGGLGLADYGVYSIAFAAAGYGAFLDLGFGWAAVRFAADAHARQQRWPSSASCGPSCSTRRCSVPSSRYC
jgi:O-antigen/teichoic acid export membrane protein